MSERPALLSESGLEALAAAAALLEWPLPRLHDEAMCDGLAHKTDAFLARVARGRGALDLALGEGLQALSIGDRVLRLGYSSIGDYARERLGIPASTAAKMARFASALRARPLLREAVLSGEVSVRQAEAVMPLAVGEAEEWWVARARADTVRGLKASVKACGAPEPEQEEKWGRMWMRVPDQARPVIDEAIARAGKFVGATAPKWPRLQAMAQEYLGSHPAADSGRTTDEQLSAAGEEWLAPEMEWLEKETARWAFLAGMVPVCAPGPTPDPHADPRELDDQLRSIASARDDWDGVFGHLALVFHSMDGWRRMQFASFGHYCAERLGMAVRTVEQRIALERRLHDLPSLRRAMRERRVSYEKARLLARYTDEKSIGDWIARAEQLTCIDLRRALEADREAQTCARREFQAVVPREVRDLLVDAFGAARKEAGTWLSPGECLRRIAEHCVATWKAGPPERNTVQKRVLARDRGRCQVPGCSRAATQVHHIEYRSAGGSDDPSNLVSLCAAHHLYGVHMGWIRVTAEGPDRLRWQLGVRPGLPPLVEIVTPRARCA